MTEIQARYYTNEALRRGEENLDHAYNELLESRELEQLENEALEDEILGDEELFNRLASSYCRRSLGIALSDPKRTTPPSEGFLEFGVRTLRRERTAEHSGGWEEKPSNAEYWNWDDKRV